MKQTIKRNALGRGLGALLRDNQPEEPQLGLDSVLISKPIAVTLGNTQEINLSDIQTNPFQPRTYFDKDSLAELADSIRIQGIIQPVTLRQLSPGQYQIIAGERRCQAARLAGLNSIPCYIRTANDQQMLEMALIENIQRENLNALEIALSYQRLIYECNLKQEELGDRVGKKRSTINNYLRLLRLPPQIQAAIRDTHLSMGHARALVNVENVDAQLFIFNKIIKDEISVRKVEELVRDLASQSLNKNKPSPKQNLSSQAVAIQSKLVSHFGTKVQIKNGIGERGEIRIPFVSQQDLNRILEVLDIS